MRSFRSTLGLDSVKLGGPRILWHTSIRPVSSSSSRTRRRAVKETTVDQVKARLDRGETLQLVDVREESEYAKDHLPGAIHLGKGVIERDVEQSLPDAAAEIILYCGGGFRSALAADNLQKMGYTNVISMDGGVRELARQGLSDDDGLSRSPVVVVGDAQEEFASGFDHNRDSGPRAVRPPRVLAGVPAGPALRCGKCVCR